MLFKSTIPMLAALLAVAACSADDNTSNHDGERLARLLSPPKPDRATQPPKAPQETSNQRSGQLLPAFFVGVDGACTVTQAAGGSYSHSYESTQFAIDCAAATGTLLFAPAGGKRQVDDDPAGAYGKNVRIALFGSNACVSTNHQSTTVGGFSEALFGENVGTVGSTGASTGPHVHIVVGESCADNAKSLPWRACARFGSANAAVTCKAVTEIKVGDVLHFGGIDGRALTNLTLTRYLQHLVDVGTPPAAAAGDTIVAYLREGDQADVDRWEYTIIPLSDGSKLVGAIDRTQVGGKSGDRLKFLGEFWAIAKTMDAELDWARVADGPSFDEAWTKYLDVVGLAPPSTAAVSFDLDDDWEVQWRDGMLEGEASGFVIARNRLDRSAIAMGVVWRANEKEKAEFFGWFWLPQATW